MQVKGPVDIPLRPRKVSSGKRVASRFHAKARIVLDRDHIRVARAAAVAGFAFGAPCATCRTVRHGLVVDEEQ